MTGEQRRTDAGVRRRVIFQAWCSACLFGWSGPERDRRYLAEFDRAQHDVNLHGGARRIGDES